MGEASSLESLAQVQIRLSKIKWADVPFNSIQNHPVHDDKKTSMGLQDYDLRYVTGELSVAAYRLIELSHPILVVPTEEDEKEWECLVGYRTLVIARLVLKPGDLVTVGKLPAMESEGKARMCYADLILSPLALSLNKPAKTLTRMLAVKYVTRNMVPVLLPRIAENPANLANALGISSATLARAKKTVKDESDKVQ